MSMLTRRKFLKMAGISCSAAAAMALVGCGSSSSSESSSSTGSGDDESTQASASTSSDDLVSGTDASASMSEGTVEVDGDYSVLRVGVSALSKSLAPWNITSSSDYVNPFYQQLSGTYVSDGSSKPYLCNSVTFSDDNLKMYFNLYDNIYDTDGNHITASDVAFSFDSAKSVGYTGMSDFASWEATGEYDFELTLKEEPTASGEPVSTYIVSETAYNESVDGFSQMPVSCGPYKVQSFTSDYCMILEKNEDFWATEEQIERVDNLWKTRWDTIEFWQIAETSQQCIALQNATIDFCAGIANEDMFHFEEGGDYSDQYTVWNYIDGLTYSLVFNTDEASPCHDVNLRKAICYAIDSDAIISFLWGGDALKTHEACGRHLVDYNEAWDEEDNYYNYDVEKAKELLAEAGYPDGLSLVFMCSSDTTFSDMGVVIQSLLREIGIDMEIQSLDTSIVNEYKENDHSCWDISPAKMGGTLYVFTSWEKAFAQGTKSWPGTTGYYYDETLDEMLKEYCSIEGNTDENREALHEYTIERCLVYGIANCYTKTVIKKGIMPVLNEQGSSVIYNALYYYDAE